MFLGAWRKYDFSRAITFTFVPFSLKPSTIYPIVYTKALLFIFIIPAFVLPSIRPFVNALSMHHIIFPFTFISPSIALLINSFAFNFALIPVSIVDWSIYPAITSFSVFETILELSLVSIPFSSYLCAIAFRLIILPWTWIDIAVLFHKFTLTMGFGVDPITFVIIARRVGKLPTAVGLIVLPLADIDSFIGPSLSAESISLIVGYLSMVGHSRLKPDDKYISLTVYNCILR